MKRLSLLLLFVLGAWLGRLVPSIQAAPPEVQGSSNVAVDVYENRSGTFILWSNGRLTRASGGGQDLGRPYRLPPSAAQIGRPPLKSDASYGSPHVAVSAWVRTEATYVVFADGSIRLPAHSDAAAGAVQSREILSGCWARGASKDSEKYSVSVSSDRVQVQLNEEISGNYHAFAMGADQDGLVVPFVTITGAGSTRSLLFRVPEPGGYRLPENGYFMVIAEDE